MTTQNGRFFVTHTESYTFPPELYRMAQSLYTKYMERAVKEGWQGIYMESTTTGTTVRYTRVVGCDTIDGGKE